MNGLEWSGQGNRMLAAVRMGWGGIFLHWGAGFVIQSA